MVLRKPSSASTHHVSMSEALAEPNNVREGAVMIAIGIVPPNCLFIPPTGNFNLCYVTMTKFRLSLIKPNDHKILLLQLKYLINYRPPSPALRVAVI